MPSREVIKATIAGLVATTVLVVLVIVGSRNLSHFDAALFAYLFATIFAVFDRYTPRSQWRFRGQGEKPYAPAGPPRRRRLAQACRPAGIA